MIDVLEMMMGPAAILLRFALIIGSFWLVPMALRLLRDEAREARRQAVVEHARHFHPAGADWVDEYEMDLPYDFDREDDLGRSEDLLAVYDEVVLDGYAPDADETFEAVAVRLDVPVDRVRTLLETPWLE